jgi:hypothetical protein
VPEYNGVDWLQAESFGIFLWDFQNLWKWIGRFLGPLPAVEITILSK